MISSTTTVDQLPCFKDLIAVLFECLLIISLGYLSARFKLISNEAKDLNSYLTTFALPMIIFLNIAKMEFQTINFSFLICILISKIAVFKLVTLLTLTISYPTNFGYAGALSILATQSNDFALGYPLIKSLYGKSKPEMLNYLSLMAPIQLLILNPLGIAMLEYEKSRSSSKQSKESVHVVRIDGDGNTCSRSDNNTSESLKHRDPLLASPKSFKGYCNSCCKPKRQPEGQMAQTDSSKKFRSVDRSKLIHHLRGPLKQASSSTHQGMNKQTLGREGMGNEDNIRSRGNPKQQSRDSKSLIQKRNVKSLTLAMPARPAENFGSKSGSDESIDTLDEFRSKDELVDYGGGAARDCVRHGNVDDSPLFIVAGVTTSRRSSDSNSNRLLQQVRIAPIPHHDLSSESTTFCTCPSDPLDNQQAKQLPIDNQTPAHSTTNLDFLKALTTNPLIIASVVALAVNLINGPELPKIITKVSNTLAASFAGPSLFVIGLSMYGKFELMLRNPTDLLLASVLVLTKVLLLPNLMRTLALLILPNYTPAEEVQNLIDFSFLYGLLPTAPTACIIAKQYGVLCNVVTTSMLLSTFISAPSMLASSFIIYPSTSTSKLEAMVDIVSQTMKFAGVTTLTLASLTLYSFWKSKKRFNYTNLNNMPDLVNCRPLNKIKTSPTDVFLFLLTVSQAFIGFGGFFWYFVDTGDSDLPKDHINIQSHSLTGTSMEGLPNIPNMTLMIGQVAVPIPIQLPDQEPISPLLPEPIESWVPSSHQSDFGFKTLSAFQYVTSSIGLMMARFVIFCLLVTMAATRLKGHVIGAKVSTSMVKVFLTVGAILSIWLIYDSSMVKHISIEPSLPSNTSSMCVRFFFNTVFLLVSTPLFAWILRSVNKSNYKELNRIHDDNNVEPPDHGACPSFAERRFVTSSASLTSDASSALTINTNLEPTQSAQTPLDSNNIGANLSHNHPSSDTLSVVLDCRSLEAMKKPISHFVQQANLYGSTSTSAEHNRTNLNTISNTNNRNNNHGIGTSEVYQDHSPTEHQYENAEEQKITLNNNDDSIHNNIPLTRAQDHNKMTEFNKYSIIIVFTLVVGALNMTSIAQKLMEEQPFGTFRQIEVIDVALQFGQGLLTFLVYGMQGVFCR